MKVWQKKLRLLDWKVKVRLVGSDRFDRVGKAYGHSSDNAYGFCEQFPEGRIATIYILSLSDSGDTARASIKNTLVHELLHLVFSPFASKHDEDSLAHEQAIEVLAEVLVGE